jgi:hypothetical protein
MTSLDRFIVTMRPARTSFPGVAGSIGFVRGLTG